MRFSSVLVASLVSLASSHPGPRDGSAAMPKLLGVRQFLSEMKGRNVLLNIPDSVEAVNIDAFPEPISNLKIRQNVNGQCGAGFGSCAAGTCCSPAG